MPIYDDPWEYYLAARAVQPEARRDYSIAPLEPEEQESLLSKAVQVPLSALHFVGKALDETFGGRAIRGLLAGKPRELLSPLPFSDTIGLTDPAQRTSGEDLARQWGILHGEGTKGTFEMRDLVGPAIEIALDPARFIGFGTKALTEAGEAARRLGVAPKTTLGRIRGYQTADEAAAAAGVPAGVLAQRAADVGIDLNEVVGRPLGGAMSVRTPFTSDRTVLGTGGTAEAALDKLSDVTGWLGERAPMTWLKAGFNKVNRGRPEPDFQALAGRHEPYRRSALEESEQAWLRVSRPLMELGEAGQLDKRTMFRVLEDKLPIDQVPNLTPELRAALESAKTEFSRFDQAKLAAMEAAGVPIRQMQSVYDTPHVHRQSIPPGHLKAIQSTGKPRGQSESLSMRFGPVLGREEFLDMPGGSAHVDHALADPRIGTLERKPVDFANQPIPRIMADAPEAKKVADRIVASANKFSAEAERDYQMLKASARSPSERKRLKDLNQARIRSAAEMKAAFEEFLGGQRGDVIKQKRGQSTRLEKMERQLKSGVIRDDDAELLRLRQLRDESVILTKRMYQLRREGARGLWKDWRDEIIPALNTARQDRAAERILLSDYFNYNPQRHRELAQTASGYMDEGRTAYEEWLAGTAEGKEFRQLGHAKKNAPRLASWLGTQHPERATAGMFMHPLQSIRSGWQSADEAIARGRLVQDYLAQVGDYTRTPAPGMRAANEVLREAGVRKEARQRLLQGLNQRGAFGVEPGRPLDLRNIHVTPEQANVLLGVYSRGGPPTWMQGPLNATDQFLNLFRMGVLSWPARHARDAVSSIYQNISEGVVNPFRSMQQADLLRQGKAIPGIAAEMGAANRQFVGMTDEQATKLLGEMLFSTHSGSRMLAPTREVIGDLAAEAAPSFRDLVPGYSPQPSLTDALMGKPINYQAPVSELLNPMAIRGIGGRTENTFVPAQWSHGVGAVTDAATRDAAFIDMIRRGFTPQAAAQELGNIHPDWTRMSDFERNVMRRIFPFYSWTSFVVPQTFRNIARSPGGLTAQAIRVGADMRQRSGFLPPYLGHSLAIPAGAEDDTGTRRYLTRIDLPFEDPLQMLSVGPGGAAQTGMRLLGQLNPLVKGPLEYFTQRQFFTGRDMADLYSPTGYRAFDQLAMNSPAARAYTTVRTLTDPRKWAAPEALVLNLLTGARLSDVDVAGARLRYGPAAVRELLSASPNVRTFEDISVSQDRLANLTPEQLLLLRLYKSLQRDARDEYRQRQAQPRLP